MIHGRHPGALLDRLDRLAERCLAIALAKPVRGRIRLELARPLALQTA